MRRTALALALLALAAAPAPPRARLYTFAAATRPAEVPAPPGELHAACLYDAEGFARSGGDPRNLLYLSLHGVAPAERDDFYAALKLALYHVKWRQTAARPVRFYSGLLVRVDLAEYGQDAPNRRRRIAFLKSQGVDTSTFKEDLRAVLADLDPYWFTDTADAHGHPYRGWLDPAADHRLRCLTYAPKALLSAHHVLPLLLSDDTRVSKEFPNGRGGVYSQALMVPPAEADLYKSLGVPSGFFDADSQLKAGIAVTASQYVAKGNRLLVYFPNAYGGDVKFGVRTSDFFQGTGGDPLKNVLATLLDRLKHDGREVIWTKPDGGHAYALYDGQGKQIAIVPPQVAVDRRTDWHDDEKAVVSAWKCISCHMPESGLISAEDKVGKLGLAAAAKISVYGKDPDTLARVLTETNDFYYSGLPAKVGSYRRSYAAGVATAAPHPPRQAAGLVATWVEAYGSRLVTPAQAARETGYGLDTARLLWKTAVVREVVDGHYTERPDPQLVALAAGEPVDRFAWEKSFRNVMQADRYPWEYGGMEWCAAVWGVPYAPPPPSKEPAP